MKTLIYLFFLFSNYIFSQNGYVEYNPYGPTYSVESNVKNKIDRVKAYKLDSMPVKTMSFLYFNKFESSYQTNFQNNQIPDKEFNLNSKTNTINISNSGIDSLGQIIYRNFKTKEIKFRVMESITDAYLVEDNWLEINWTIFDEYKEIEGYKVQKAGGYFRGRKYIVWFTREIPSSYGPWKLFGLPGLILETYDPKLKNGKRAVNICYPCTFDFEIETPKEKNSRTIEEHVYYRDHPHLLIAKKINEKLGQDRLVLLKENTTTSEDIKQKRIYAPEIQYEWEKFPGDTPKPEKLEENLIIVDKLEDFKPN